jgi:hypothetical protein
MENRKVLDMMDYAFSLGWEEVYFHPKHGWVARKVNGDVVTQLILGSLENGYNHLRAEFLTTR